MTDDNPELSDDLRYRASQERQSQAWESQCTRCGACCGAIEGDPCEHLAKDESGKYFCRIYETRFGLRRAVSGRYFRCVPIRDILHQNWPGDQLAVIKRPIGFY